MQAGRREESQLDRTSAAGNLAVRTGQSQPLPPEDLTNQHSGGHQGGVGLFTVPYQTAGRGVLWRKAVFNGVWGTVCFHLKAVNDLLSLKVGRAAPGLNPFPPGHCRAFDETSAARKDLRGW